MPGQMVDPPLLPQLGHYGINPRETSPALCPFCQSFGVPVPRDLHADGIELHFVKVWVVGGSRVEELTPEQLTVKRQWRDAIFLDLHLKSQEKKDEINFSTTYDLTISYHSDKQYLKCQSKTVRFSLPFCRGL